MATITVVTRFLATTRVFIVMAGFASIGIYLVTRGAYTRKVSRKIWFFQSHRGGGMRAMTGITLDHGMGHF